MNKKEFLRAYARAKQKEIRIMMMIDEFRTRQMGCAVKYSDMPKCTDLHDLSDYMCGLEEIETMYTEQMAETSKVFDIVLKALNTVNDKDSYCVLFEKYILGKSAFEIGEELNMTDWNVYKIEKKAIEKMEVSSFDIEMVESLLTYKTIPEMRARSKIA